jgi:hypothetical protein
MTKKNPFQNIEPEVSIPEDLKNEILQEVEEIIANEEENDEEENNIDPSKT